MERRFEIDRIKFTPTSLAGRPTHAALLATIFTSFSLTEGAIGGIYGLLKPNSAPPAPTAKPRRGAVAKLA